jgi:hypothetical protein
VNIRPLINTFANNTGLLAIKTSANQLRDLNRVWILDASVREFVLGNTINRGRKNNIGSDITTFPCCGNGQIDLTMDGFTRNRFDEGNVKVRVDLVRGILTTGVIAQYTRNRSMNIDLSFSSSLLLQFETFADSLSRFDVIGIGSMKDDVRLG